MRVLCTVGRFFRGRLPTQGYSGARFVTHRSYMVLYPIMLMSSVVSAATITVDVGGGADHTTIQDAIDAASDGDEIVVSPGTYTSDGSAVVDTLGKAILIRSSGASLETIIDGKGERIGLHFDSNETSSTVIDGFTITNGYDFIFGGGVAVLNDSNPTIQNCIIDRNTTWSQGAGIICYSSSPAITNCTISNNNTTYALGKGGGIAIIGTSSPILSGCIISGNQAGTLGGGGVWCQSMGAVIDNCTITLNQTSGDGGGLYVGPDSGIDVTNCTISNNEASTGGGMWSASSASPALVDSTVCGNLPNQVEDSDPEADLWDVEGNAVLDVCGASGACCHGEACTVLTEADCQLTGGTYEGTGTDCEDEPCVTVPFGGCCISISCSELTLTMCNELGGSFLGHGTTCDGLPCSSDDAAIRWHYLGDNLTSEPEPHWTVDIYVEIPTDWRLDAVAGTSNQTLSVSTTGTFYQHASGGNLSSHVNAAFYTLLPDLEWDSRFMIGCADSTCGGTGDDALNDLNIDYSAFEAGGDVTADHGAWFITSDEPQGETEDFTDDSTGQLRNGVRVARLTIFGLDEELAFEGLFQGKTDGGAAWQSSAMATISNESSPPPTCQGDLNTDGAVSVLDLEELLEYWGSNNESGDINGDGAVNVPDLLLQLMNWGICEG